MNPTRSYKKLGFLALAALAACLTPASLRAQTVFKGSFTLPVETRWGTAVLPAGTYSFTMQSATESSLTAVRDEQGQPVMITSSYGTSEGKASDASQLIVLRSSGKVTVRALYLQPLGMTFYYPLPKDDRKFVTQAPQLIQRVPVSAAGK